MTPTPKNFSIYQLIPHGSNGHRFKCFRNRDLIRLAKEGIEDKLVDAFEDLGEPLASTRTKRYKGIGRETHP